MLGEISAFGGINVEPSVRSCFEKAGDTGFIEVVAMKMVNMMIISMDRMVMIMMMMINVEPSVRSCFEKAGDTGFIEVIARMV